MRAGRLAALLLEVAGRRFPSVGLEASAGVLGLLPELPHPNRAAQHTAGRAGNGRHLLLRLLFRDFFVFFLESR